METTQLRVSFSQQSVALGVTGALLVVVAVTVTVPATVLMLKRKRKREMKKRILCWKK